MLRSFRSLVPFVLVAAIACGSRAQAVSQEALPFRLDTLAARGDTAALAALADAQCPGDKATRQSCLENFFVTLAGKGRIAVSLGALAKLGAQDEDVARDGHGYTHVIGIRAWKPGDDVAAAFKGCNGLFQSGCYHGVIQAYLTADGSLDSLRSVQLCDQIASKERERWLRFQCVHGLGHGFEMAHNWDLPKALEGCDWLPDGWDRESCYGGAFMENAVASMPGGHHTSVTALAVASKDTAGGHAHGGHGNHAPDLGKVTFKMRDSADALYPCSVTAEKYRRACYTLQGGIILNRVNGSFAKAAPECDKAPEAWRTACYQSLGTNAAGMSGLKAGKAIDYCSNGDPKFQPFCFVGVVKNFIDVTAKPEDGMAFCRDVPIGLNRQACWFAVGEQVLILNPADLDARGTACAKAGAEGEPECRRGAAIAQKS